MSSRQFREDCIAERGIKLHKPKSEVPHVHWLDGDVFQRIAGQFVGAPRFNPECSHYRPSKSSGNRFST